MDLTDMVVKDKDTLSTYLSSDWHDHVMSHFVPDELDPQGNPTVDGLRRVAESLLGTIINAKTRIHRSCETYAVVEYSITIDLKDGTMKSCRDVAECSVDNTEKEYAKFPHAVAATRAEGRVLRKLLKLRKVIAAEERAKPADEPDKINSSQITCINMLCNRNNINKDKLLKKHQIDPKTFNDIPYQKAIEIIKQLNDFQNEKLPLPKDLVKEKS